MLYQIALTLLRGVGPSTAKKLVANCGSAEEVFGEKKENLQKIEEVPRTSLNDLGRKEALIRAEKEVRFCENKGIQVHFYLDPAYPRRLRHIDDGPVVLFQKGHTDLNASKVIAMVGTRSATEYSEAFCEKFIRDLQPYQPLIISGMAYGADAMAHRGALANNLPTVGVMAHGLDVVYPYLHRSMAEEIIDAGGSLVSEFLSNSRPDRENFPKRNRIIAGVSEATIVLEAAKKGGALITAQLADGYHRDVFALPGRYNDRFCEGANDLIKAAKANMLTGVKDLEYILGWEKENPNSVQKQLFLELPAEEQKLYDLLESKNKALELEYLCAHLQLPVSKVLQLLMSMELKGIVKALPGKAFTKV